MPRRLDRQQLNALRLVPDAAERLRLDPAIAEQLRLPDNLRAWLNSPAERRLRENARQVNEALYRPDEPEPVPPPEPARKRKGGRKPALTPEQIEIAQKLLRSELRDRPELASKPKPALKHLMTLIDYGVSDRTMLRWIVEPVLTEAETK